MALEDVSEFGRRYLLCKGSVDEALITTWGGFQTDRLQIQSGFGTADRGRAMDDCSESERGRRNYWAGASKVTT